MMRLLYHLKMKTLFRFLTCYIFICYLNIQHPTFKKAIKLMFAVIITMIKKRSASNCAIKTFCNCNWWFFIKNFQVVFTSFYFVFVAVKICCANKKSKCEKLGISRIKQTILASFSVLMFNKFLFVSSMEKPIQFNYQF